MALRTLFGFHRVTLSRPYRSASPDNRFLSSTRSFASMLRPGKLARAGCTKGLRPKRSGTGLPWASLGQVSACGELRRACEVCSEIIRLPVFQVSYSVHPLAPAYSCLERT